MSNFFKAIKNKKPIKHTELEYRLYYNKDTGLPLFYSMDTNTSGDFIIVDKETYSLADYNVVVKDNTLIKKVFKDVSKLTQHGTETTCHKSDISIVSTSGINWSLRLYDN